MVDRQTLLFLFCFLLRSTDKVDRPPYFRSVSYDCYFLKDSIEVTCVVFYQLIGNAVSSWFSTGLPQKEFTYREGQEGDLFTFSCL